MRACVRVCMCVCLCACVCTSVCVCACVCRNEFHLQHTQHRVLFSVTHPCMHCPHPIPHFRPLEYVCVGSFLSGFACSQGSLFRPLTRACIRGPPSCPLPHLSLALGRAIGHQVHTQCVGFEPFGLCTCVEHLVDLQHAQHDVHSHS